MRSSSGSLAFFALRPGAPRLSLLGGALLLLFAGGCVASAPGPGEDAGARSCPSECFVGHRCCRGSCDGPSVSLPSDCCECVGDEVSSSECPGSKCSD